MAIDLMRRAGAELIGTALLVGAALGGARAAAAAGAGIPMAMLIGAFAVAAALVALLHSLRPPVDGHLNPAITVSMVAANRTSPMDGVIYVVCQVLGAFGGAWAARAIWPDGLAGGAGFGNLDWRAYVAEIIAVCALAAAWHASTRSPSSRSDGAQTRIRPGVAVPAAMLAGALVAPFGLGNPALGLAAGVVTGSEGLSTIGQVVALALVAAAVVGLIAALGDSLARSDAGAADADDRPGLRSFEVRMAPGLSRDARDDVIRSVRAALRPQDVVVYGDGVCRVMLADADDQAIDAVRQRIETVIALSSIDRQLHRLDFELVPLN